MLFLGVGMTVRAESWATEVGLRTLTEFGAVALAHLDANKTVMCGSKRGSAPVCNALHMTGDGFMMGPNLTLPIKQFEGSLVITHLAKDKAAACWYDRVGVTCGVLVAERLELSVHSVTVAKNMEFIPTLFGDHNPHPRLAPLGTDKAVLCFRQQIMELDGIPWSGICKVVSASGTDLSFGADFMVVDATQHSTSASLTSTSIEAAQLTSHKTAICYRSVSQYKSIVDYNFNSTIGYCGVLEALGNDELQLGSPLPVTSPPTGTVPKIAMPPAMEAPILVAPLRNNSVVACYNDAPFPEHIDYDGMLAALLGTGRCVSLSVAGRTLHKDTAAVVRQPEEDGVGSVVLRAIGPLADNQFALVYDVVVRLGNGDMDLSRRTALLQAADSKMTIPWESHLGHKDRGIDLGVPRDIAFSEMSDTSMFCRIDEVLNPFIDGTALWCSTLGISHAEQSSGVSPFWWIGLGLGLPVLAASIIAAVCCCRRRSPSSSTTSVDKEIEEVV